MLSQAAKHMDAYSLHYYTFPGRWENKGSSIGFTEDAVGVDAESRRRVWKSW